MGGMSTSEQQTVGSLLGFLNEELKKGNIDHSTPISIEIYALYAHEVKLKEKQEELGYHVPDRLPDDCIGFSTGVWKGVPEGQSKGNYIAFNTYPLRKTLSENIRKTERYCNKKNKRANLI